MITMVAFGLAAGAAEYRVQNADEFHRRIKSAVAGDVIVLASGEWLDVELIADATGLQKAPSTIFADSPLVDAGCDLPELAKTHSAKTQPSGSLPDVGCDRWPVDEESTTMTDVNAGPSWSPINRLP